MECTVCLAFASPLTVWVALIKAAQEYWVYRKGYDLDPESCWTLLNIILILVSRSDFLWCLVAVSISSSSVSEPPMISVNSSAEGLGGRPQRFGGRTLSCFTTLS